ncbi:MAG TPA: hypothetical protein VFQ22_05865 [Longimicrobiales bacterium]|nr:hypothetical protein [Longimicrobiales bacterium]
MPTSPELLIGLVVVFASGGAIGSAGTLLAQWIFRRMDGRPTRALRTEAEELRALRSELTEMGRHLHNLEERLDFTERLLDGALPLAPRPAGLDEDPGDGAAPRA